jgi:aryl-alcohol dehydrogenase-like predicted oxidoreductase
LNQESYAGAFGASYAELRISGQRSPSFDRGVTFFDAAEAYGPHEVERILGEGVEPFRNQVVITSKFGWNIDLETGVRGPGLNSRPDHIKLAVEGMLRRLRTDRIDLLYQCYASASWRRVVADSEGKPFAE